GGEESSTDAFSIPLRACRRVLLACHETPHNKEPEFENCVESYSRKSKLIRAFFEGRRTPPSAELFALPHHFIRFLCRRIAGQTTKFVLCSGYDSVNKSFAS